MSSGIACLTLCGLYAKTFKAKDFELPETRQSMYAALIPHGNIRSALLHEQNTLLSGLAARDNRAGFARFMPLCLFLRENFETAARMLAAGKQENAASVVIMPPVSADGLIVYPVKLSVDLTPVIPPFLERRLPDNPAPRGKNGCGFVTAFAPVQTDACAPDAAEIIRCAERKMTVFKLCQIEFRAAGSRAWEWKTRRTKWIKLRER